MLATIVVHDIGRGPEPEDTLLALRPGFEPEGLAWMTLGPALAAALLFVSVGALASCPPALRAALTDPARVMRA